MNEHRFSLVQDVELEAMMAEVVAEIGGDIAILPEARWMDCVLLGGGYGRGEGGVATTDSGRKMPYNDLDFFVFSAASARELRQVDMALRKVAEKWAQRLQIEVDFAPARSWRSLRKVSATIMYQELRYGHLAVCGTGEERFMREVPELRPEQLPLLEGFRLLLNRGTGLLLAEQAWNSERRLAEQDFIGRNLHKCALGCGDALLLKLGLYDYSIAVRKERIAALSAGEWRALSERYAAAVAFKAAPGKSEDDFFSTIEAAKNLWRQVLRLYVGCNSKVDSEDEILAGLAWNRSFGGCRWKNLLLNGIYLKGEFFRGNSFLAPQIRILPKLFNLLFAKREEVRYSMQQNGYGRQLNDFLCLWRRFN